MMVGVYTDIFLVIAILAGIASIFGAYYRGMIQWLLTPSYDEISRDLRVYYILCGLAFAVAIFGFIFNALNISFWKVTANEQSILGDLGIIFIAGSLIILIRSRPPRKLAYFGVVAAIVIGFLILAGNWLLIRFLVNPFHTGHTSDLAAVGLIAASMGAVLSMQRGLKTWVAQFIPVTLVLIIAILAFVGYMTNIPTLYTEGAYVGISASTVICFLLIGSAQIWYAWNRR
jgi:hypothetical protein